MTPVFYLFSHFYHTSIFISSFLSHTLAGDLLPAGEPALPTGESSLTPAPTMVF